MRVNVLGVQDNGEILQLRLSPSDEFARVAGRSHGGKLLPIPQRDLHITLCASCGNAAVLPAPPTVVELSAIAELVARMDKASVFLRVSEATQQILNAYVGQVANLTGAAGLLDKRRIFHVSLANLTGAARDSIARVWEYSPVAYHPAEYGACLRMQRNAGSASPALQ